MFRRDNLTTHTSLITTCSWFHINRPLEDASANVLNAAFVAQVRARVVELHEEHALRTKRLLSLGEVSRVVTGACAQAGWM